LDRNWPKVEEKYLEEEEVEIAVLIGGKVRGKLKIDVNWPKEKIEQEALALDKIKKLLLDKKPKKIIYVDKKVVNIVI